jgi:hypothetical protein
MGHLQMNFLLDVHKNPGFVRMNLLFLVFMLNTPKIKSCFKYAYRSYVNTPYWPNYSAICRQHRCEACLCVMSWPNHISHKSYAALVPAAVLDMHNKQSFT